MDKEKLNKLLDNPNSIVKEEYESLQELRKKEKYVQAFYPLIAIGSKKFSQKDYKKEIQSAALYTLDRAHLKKLISQSATDEDRTKEPATKVLIKNRAATKEEKIGISDHKEPSLKPRPHHLPDSFFDELYKEMDQLQASKKAYQELMSKLENDFSGKTKPKAKSTKKKTQEKESVTSKKAAVKKTSKASTSQKGKESSNSSQTKKSIAKKVVKIRPLAEGEHQSILDEIKLKEVKAIQDEHLKEQINLITSFIEKEPSINKKMLSNNVDAKRVIEDLSESSTHLSDDVISETLAKLMVQQGRKEKAIDIYKKLIWKFPQKKTYFADQIKKLKIEE